MFLRIAVLALGLAASTPACADGAASITLEKQGCFGACPSYSITVHADDSYEWHGRRFVAVVGTSRGLLSAGSFDAAMQRLQSVRYRDFADRYVDRADCPEWWTDNPSTRLTVVSASGTKAIDHYAGCRGFAHEVELKAIEDSLDRLFHVDELDGAMSK